MATHINNKLTPKEVSAMLGVNVNTLSVWRCTKRYPLAYIKVGAKVFYRTEDVEKFIAKRTHSGIKKKVKFK